MTNIELWDKLGKTDPAHTKKFKRSGGFEGTAIKPIWSYKRMTEEFGPCGKGWGVGEPTFQVVAGPEGEVLVFCTASVWYESREQVAYGVGGDKAVGKNKYGLNADDEAFKKAYTDAVTNALKMIGVGADVHMGLYDDNKYVNSMRDEFEEAKNPKPKADPDKIVIADTMVEAMKQSQDRAELDEWRAKQKAEIDDLDEVNRERVLNAMRNLWKSLPKVAA